MPRWSLLLKPQSVLYGSLIPGILRDAAASFQWSRHYVCTRIPRQSLGGAHWAHENQSCMTLWSDESSYSCLPQSNHLTSKSFHFHRRSARQFSSWSNTWAWLDSFVCHQSNTPAALCLVPTFSLNDWHWVPTSPSSLGKTWLGLAPRIDSYLSWQAGVFSPARVRSLAPALDAALPLNSPAGRHWWLPFWERRKFRCHLKSAWLPLLLDWRRTQVTPRSCPHSSCYCSASSSKDFSTCATAWTPTPPVQSLTHFCLGSWMDSWARWRSYCPWSSLDEWVTSLTSLHTLLWLSSWCSIAIRDLWWRGGLARTCALCAR